MPDGGFLLHLFPNGATRPAAGPVPLAPLLQPFLTGRNVSTLLHIQEIIQDVYEKYKDINEGEVATYIPELAKANPDHFGIAMSTVDGLVCSAGEYTVRLLPPLVATRDDLARGLEILEGILE